MPNPMQDAALASRATLAPVISKIVADESCALAGTDFVRDLGNDITAFHTLRAMSAIEENIFLNA